MNRIENKIKKPKLKETEHGCGKRPVDREDFTDTEPKLDIDLTETSMDLDSYYKIPNTPTQSSSGKQKKEILIDFLGSSETENNQLAPNDELLETAGIEKPVFKPIKTEELNLDLGLETDELDPLQDSDEETTDNDTKKFNSPASIRDLLDNPDSLEPIIAETSNMTSAAKNFKNSDLDSKAIEQFLVIPEQNKDAWEQQDLEEGKPLRDERKKRIKKKILTMVAVVLVILAGAGGVFYYFLVLQPNGNQKNSVRHLTDNGLDFTIKSVENLVIDPDIKDKNKLVKFFKYSEQLYHKKQYKKTIILCKKLLPLKWKQREVYALLGKSYDKQDNLNEAVKSYEKAVVKEYFADRNVPLRLMKILEEQKKYNKIIKLRKFLKLHFSSDLEIQGIIAKAFFKTGQAPEAEKVLKKFNIQLFDRDLLNEYGEILEANKNTALAYRVYYLLGQNFSDRQALEKALKHAHDNRTKITVLAELISKTKGSNDCDAYKLLMAEVKLKEGRKSEIYKTLVNIKVDKLNEKNTLKYIKLISLSNNSFSVIHSISRVISGKYIENVEFQEQVLNELTASGRLNYAEKIFNSLLEEQPNNPVLNYICAQLSDDQKTKMTLLHKAFNINPNFHQVAMSLGKIAYDMSQWKKALSYFRTASLANPLNLKTKYWIALTHIRQKNDKSTFLDYEQLLDSEGIQTKQKFSQLIKLAQYYKTDKIAVSVLDRMSKIPELKEMHYEQSIKTKLIYSTLKESDFKKNYLESSVKKYKILFLLSQGKLNDIMELPTLKTQFPEFWKVFICWRKSLKSWIRNSKLLLEKHPDDKAYMLSVFLWRGKIKPADARELIPTLDYEDKPLVYLMIAEAYRRRKNKLKALVAYQAAIRYSPPNMYKGTALFLKKGLNNK